MGNKYAVSIMRGPTLIVIVKDPHDNDVWFLWCFFIVI